jgi:hypothetical protein
MPCERVEQSLSRSVLEDTYARALMEIVMAKSLGDICLFACSLQNPSSGHRAARSCLEPEGGSWSPDDTWRPRSCPEPGGGSRSRGDTWQPQSCPQSGDRSHCLDLMLVRGVPSPQDTDNGPRAHPGRGCKPTGGANILSPRNLSESLYVGILKRWCSTADTWRPTIHTDVAMLTKSSRATVPRGPLLLSGNRGA